MCSGRPAMTNTLPFGPTRKVTQWRGRGQGRGYPSEQKEWIVELVKAGRSAGFLERKFEPSGQTIRNSVKQVDTWTKGRRSDGLTTEARKQVEREKDIGLFATRRVALLDATLAALYYIPGRGFQRFFSQKES